MPQPVGPAPSTDELLSSMYLELRSIARRRMAGEARAHVLQPTALVHEAFLRLRELDRITWRGRTHFLAVAAGQMRRILVEHARAAGAGKRGGGAARVTLAEHHATSAGPSVDLLVVDRSLERLADRFPRSAKAAEMRLFAGMAVDEIARALDVTDRTIKSDWRFARAWLARDLRSHPGGRP